MNLSQSAIARSCSPNRVRYPTATKCARVGTIDDDGLAEVYDSLGTLTLY